MTGSTLTFTDNLPVVTQGPAISDKVADVTVELGVDVVETGGTTTYKCNSMKSGSNFTWMPDMILQIAQAPLIGPGDWATGTVITKQGKVTLNASATGVGYLYQKITISDVTSLQGMNLVLNNLDMATFFSMVGIGTGMGVATLYDSSNNKIKELALFPGTQGTFDYDVLASAGNNCYVKVIVGTVTLVSSDTFFLPYKVSITWAISFLNRVKDQVYDALLSGVAFGMAEILGNTVASYLTNAIDMSVGGLGDIASQVVRFLRGQGLSLSDLAAEIGVALFMRYTNDKSFDITSFFEPNNLLNLFQGMWQLLQISGSPLLIGVIGSMVGGALPAPMGSLIGFGSRAAGNILFGIGAIIYLTTIRQFVYY